MEEVDGHPVFHTINRWNTGNNAFDTDVDFTLNQILTHTPTQRPGLISAMLLSWTMLPTQAEQVVQGLPSSTYQIVLPTELPRIWQSLNNAETNRWDIILLMNDGLSGHTPGTAKKRALPGRARHTVVLNSYVFFTYFR